MAGLFSNLANDEATYMASSAENAARAEEAAVQAGQSADSASASAASAAQSASTIGSQVQTTTVNAQSAKTSEDNAKASELAAKASELAAKDSETNSEFYAIRAENADHDMQVQIDEARAWASQDTGTVNGTTEYSSKYYSVQSGLHESKAKEWAESEDVVETVNGVNFYSAHHWATDASQSANDAFAHASNASTYKNDAAFSASQSGQSASDSRNSANSAQNTLDTINGKIAVVDAQIQTTDQYLDEAIAASDKAEKWSDYIDGPVEGNIGDPDARYSAKYWADHVGEVIGAGYVHKTGDQMTGDLSIIKDTPTIYFAKTSSTNVTPYTFGLINSTSHNNASAIQSFKLDANGKSILTVSGDGFLTFQSDPLSRGNVFAQLFTETNPNYTTNNGVMNLYVSTGNITQLNSTFGLRIDQAEKTVSIGDGDIKSTQYNGSLKAYIDNIAGVDFSHSTYTEITMNNAGSGVGFLNNDNSMRSHIKYNAGTGMAELIVDFIYCANQANTPTPLPTTKLMMGKFLRDLLPVSHFAYDTGIVGGDILSRTTGAKIGEWTFDGLANSNEGRIYIVRANNSTDTGGGRFHYTYFYK